MTPLSMTPFLHNVVRLIPCRGIPTVIIYCVQIENAGKCLCNPYRVFSFSLCYLVVISTKSLAFFYKSNCVPKDVDTTCKMTSIHLYQVLRLN